VIEYLVDYQKTFNILPVLHTEAISVKRNGQHWSTETNHGSYQSKYLIMATGAFSKPKPIAFRGMETFQGKILHSLAYKTGRDFKGQKVLVVGFGNSACEIAIDLYEQGATPAMAVRSPVNVIPRDVFGIPILELSLALNPLPPKMADAISAPLIHWLVGDLRKLGLSYMPYGPLEEIRKDGNAPVLDIGTIKHIREGHITIFDDIEEIAGNIIHFKNGKKDMFDAIVAAIGYYRDYADFLKVDKSRFEDLRMPAEKKQYFGQDGLYFCGYWISPTGQIREIASDAEKIAKDIKKREGF
jgi:indole-3-pyruvate monooxygenase